MGAAKMISSAAVRPTRSSASRRANRRIEVAGAYARAIRLSTFLAQRDTSLSSSVSTSMSERRPSTGGGGGIVGLEADAVAPLLLGAIERRVGPRDDRVDVELAGFGLGDADAGRDRQRPHCPTARASTRSRVAASRRRSPRRAARSTAAPRGTPRRRSVISGPIPAARRACAGRCASARYRRTSGRSGR